MSDDVAPDPGDRSEHPQPEMPVDLAALLTAAVRDEPILDRARAVGLSATDLRQIVDKTAPELQRVGLSTFGVLQGARSRQKTASDAWHALLSRSPTERLERGSMGPTEGG
jgi:hypothetical protein